MIELYAITDHPGPALPRASALRLVPRGSLAGVCATTTASEAAVTPEALWRHERIVEELMEDRDVLPVRYGTRFADEAAAGRALEERRQQLAAALERVRGAVELAVRVIAPTADPMPVTDAPSRADASAAVSGTEYLRARMRAHASESEAVHLVHEPLSQLARDVALRPPVLPDERMRAAYLVQASAVDAFTAAVRRLQDANPSLLITCTGPWPAYTFARS